MTHVFRRSADIGLGKAELIGIWLESIIFGFEALTFVYTIHLLHGTKRNKVFFFSFAALIAMFALNTIHIGSNLRRMLNAFVSTPDNPIPDAEAYLADFVGFLYRFKNILIIVQSFMLDTLLIYRCYIIWDKKLLVILSPLAGTIAYLVTGIGAIRTFSVQKDNTVFTQHILRRWLSATLSITLATKTICLGFILAGILISRQNSSWQAFIRRSRYKGWAYKTLLITIETGGIAFLGTLILLPAYLAQSNGQETLINMLSPLSGEAFVLIFVSGLLGMIPSSSGVSNRVRRGHSNKSSSPETNPNKKRNETSTNSIFHFKQYSSYSYDDSTVLSNEVTATVIPVTPEPTTVPKAMYNAPLQPFDSPSYKYNSKEKHDINNQSQQRHPFAAASPASP